MKNIDVQQNLEAMREADQQAIRDFRAGKIPSGELGRITRTHVAALKEIIRSYGFPTIPETSANAYKAAVLIALHSEDIDLMKQLENFLESATADSVEKSDLAYVADKIRIFEGRPQLYGTQFKKKPDGTIEFLPIENPSAIDERRQKIGLESFESYKKKIASY